MDQNKSAVQGPGTAVPIHKGQLWAAHSTMGGVGQGGSKTTEQKVLLAA